MADREKPTAERDEIMTRSKTSKAAEKPEEGSRDAIEKPETTIKKIGQMEESERKMAEVLEEMRTNLALDPLSKYDANEVSETSTETANKKIQPYFEVKDIPREEMLKQIDTFMDACVYSDVKMVVEVPTQHNNMIFSHELSRWVLGMGTSKQNYSDNADKQEIPGKRKASMVCLRLIRHALESNRHLSLREIFYLRPHIFKKSYRVTTIVNSLCILFRCTRSSLHVVAAENGLVIGHVQYKQGGTAVNCLAHEGETGRLIARSMDLITEMKSIKAQFILVVEKETVFQRLVQEKFHIKVPCIIVTGRGQPDVATRLFVHRMRYELRLPTFVLMDCDAFGIRIFSTYKDGSKTLSFDSGRLTVPDIKLLGLLPSQIDTCAIPEDATTEMGEKEIKTIKELLEEEYVKINPRLNDELNRMLESRRKIELEALCFSEPLAYKTDVFVKEMIADKQWVD